MRWSAQRIVPAVFLLSLLSFSLYAADKNFHDAPDSAKAQKNPYEGQQSAVDAGKTLYARNCLACHGKTGQGTGNVPSLVDGKLKSVAPGEVFWFVTKGDTDNGMPSWAFLPEEKRWQIVNYVQALASGKASGVTNSAATPSHPTNEPASGSASAPAPGGPFTDFRYEIPGHTHKITVADLPQPYATKSAENGPDVVARPANAMPIAPAGFKVDLYASGLDSPRWMVTAPNGSTRCLVATVVGGSSTKATARRAAAIDASPPRRRSNISDGTHGGATANSSASRPCSTDAR